MAENPSQSKAPLVIGIIVLLAVLGGIGVFALNSQQTKAPSSASNQSEVTTGSTEADNQAAPNPSERMTITFTDEGFSPEEITVKKGTVVTVKNESSKMVQFSSDEHPSHRDNTEMNLMTLSPGETDSYTATAVGTWKYHDHIDESKTGTVVVTE
jgi:plastocyanin